MITTPQTKILKKHSRSTVLLPPVFFISYSGNVSFLVGFLTDLKPLLSLILLEVGIYLISGLTYFLSDLSSTFYYCYYIITGVLDLIGACYTFLVFLSSLIASFVSFYGTLIGYY